VALFARSELTAEGYADDPAFTLAGTLEKHQRIKAIIVLTWRALNLDLAFRKGQAGQDIVWIGSRLVLNASGIVAQLQGETVTELREIVRGMLEQNVVSEKSPGPWRENSAMQLALLQLGGHSCGKSGRP
jgi:hypothetical protein